MVGALLQNEFFHWSNADCLPEGYREAFRMMSSTLNRNWSVQFFVMERFTDEVPIISVAR